MYIVLGPWLASAVFALPSAEDINYLAQQASSIAEKFMQESIPERLAFQCCPESLSEDDRAGLYVLAGGASEELAVIINSGELFKKQIEDYNGADWDNLYGTTGLWRKLSADLERSRLLKCEVDYYLALAAKPDEKTEILHEIVKQISNLRTASESRAARLLKAYALVAFGESSPDYGQSAVRVVSSIPAESGRRDKIYFKAAIVEMQMTGRNTRRTVAELSRELEDSDCSNDFELNLCLALLRRRYDAGELLEKVVEKWPQSEDLVGRLILNGLFHRLENGQLKALPLRAMGVFEAECAGRRACRVGAEKYKELLENLTGIEKFQTPMLLYATAVANVEQSPDKAVSLLLWASEVCSQQKVKVLGLGARQIAAYAAQLGYGLFSENKDYCASAQVALENYLALAGDRVDEELEYHYSVVLRHCGSRREARRLLGQIATRPGGKFSNRARYDIIVDEVKKQQPANGQLRANLLQQLSDLIAATTGKSGSEGQIHSDAAILYCQLVFAEGDVLRNLRKFEQAVSALASGLDRGNCENTNLVLELLVAIDGRIDEYQMAAEDFDRMLGDALRLADHCRDCMTGGERAKASLILAEFTVFASKKGKEKLKAADKFLEDAAENLEGSDVDILRCRARLLAAQGRFDEAAELWGEICKIRRRQADSTSQPGWKWWRGKFYELDSWARIPGTLGEDVVHAIEVLEGSFNEIPPFWAERLSVLKKKVRQDELKSSQ